MSQKIRRRITYDIWMDGHKHIERTVARFIVRHYKRPVEIGVGQNWTAASLLAKKGIPVICIDIRPVIPPAGVRFVTDDIWDPGISNYAGADGIYAIRPAPEMVPPMIAIAEQVDADLIVYHLGFEIYGNGGEIIDCGVPIHRYFHRQNSNNED